MPGIRLGLGESLVHREAPPPVLEPRLLRGDELLVGDRLDARPDVRPGLRKSGMPDSVEMPAPVSATMCSDESTRRRERRDFVVVRAPIAAHMLPPAIQEPPMRYLHTMVRVTDIDQSLDFYCNKLGMVEVRRHENERAATR